MINSSLFGVKKLFRRSAAIFSLVTLLIYFLLSLIVNERKFLNFHFRFSFLPFFQSLCVRITSEQSTIFAGRQCATEKLKSSETFPFLAALATVVAFPLSLSSRCVASVFVYVPRIMNGRDITS